MQSLLTAQSWAHFWNRADAISHAVAYCLLAMSILSWFFILSKSLWVWRARQGARALTAFWQAPNMAEACKLLHTADDAQIFAPLAREILKLQENSATSSSLAGCLASADLSTRLLRQQIHEASLRLERGLTVLASIGATAPFVGLLGTVWGIYHSLSAVSAAGTAQIDKLAGPVGEALIMTGLGLLVAIPAVLAYNGLGRINRILLAELDGFAHDLQAWWLRASKT